MVRRRSRNSSSSSAPSFDVLDLMQLVTHSIMLVRSNAVAAGSSSTADGDLFAAGDQPRSTPKPAWNCATARRIISWCLTSSPSECSSDTQPVSSPEHRAARGRAPSARCTPRRTRTVSVAVPRIWSSMRSSSSRQPIKSTPAMRSGRKRLVNRTVGRRSTRRRSAAWTQPAAGRPRRCIGGSNGLSPSQVDLWCTRSASPGVAETIGMYREGSPPVDIRAQYGNVRQRLPEPAPLTTTRARSARSARPTAHERRDRGAHVRLRADRRISRRRAARKLSGDTPRLADIAERGQCSIGTRLPAVLELLVEPAGFVVSARRAPALGSLSARCAAGPSRQWC